MTPDQKIFISHLSDAKYQLGLDEGSWGISKETPWPFVLIWVKAGAKEGHPDRFHFKFNLENYPSSAPTACPWDNEKDVRLENSKWPMGVNYVSKVFNPGWNPNALYAPCDRLAMPGHEPWAAQFPKVWWNPEFKITVYLEFLFNLLNSDDYVSS